MKRLAGRYTRQDIIDEQPQIIFAERAKGKVNIGPALLLNNPPSFHSVMLFAPRMLLKK